MSTAVSATKEQIIQAPSPELAVPDALRAIALVNRWLQKEIGMAVSTAQARFIPASYCWHLPVHLAYGSTGPLGVIGDIYLHAATGELIGHPAAEELLQRATALAAAHGITGEDEEEN